MTKRGLRQSFLDPLCPIGQRQAQEELRMDDPGRSADRRPAGRDTHWAARAKGEPGHVRGAQAMGARAPVRGRVRSGAERANPRWSTRSEAKAGGRRGRDVRASCRRDDQSMCRANAAMAWAVAPSAPTGSTSCARDSPAGGTRSEAVPMVGLRKPVVRAVLRRGEDGSSQSVRDHRGRGGTDFGAIPFRATSLRPALGSKDRRTSLPS